MLLERMLFSPPNTVAIDYAKEGIICVITLNRCSASTNCSKIWHRCALALEDRPTTNCRWDWIN
jgi:hypothetical protein